MKPKTCKGITEHIKEMNKRRVLIANGDRLTQKSLYELLCRNSYKVDIVESARDVQSYLDRNAYQAVIVDLKSKADSYLVETIRHRYKDPSNMIILAPYSDLSRSENDAEFINKNYLIKPVEDEEIMAAVNRALARQEAEDLKPAIMDGPTVQNSAFHGLVGGSRVMKEIYPIISRISGSKTTILLRGESGTGKRLMAHALHKADKKRCGKPFIEISCGGLPREIIESELFGHTKGAFTGAINDRKGRFELADGGTILLDDIDCLPLDLQVKLLRVLQHKEFERVGDNKTVKVDVRIIVSTNQDLEKAIAEKKFREDLYYRLNVISIHIPPLRERKEDIPLLAEYFVGLYAKENRREIKNISGDVFNMLSGYNWPGNVRQLENIIERAVILDTDNIIGKEDLPDIIFNGMQCAGAGLDTDLMSSLKDALQEPEKIYILRILDEVGWNKKKAATKLGVNRTTLYNKLRKYNIASYIEKA